MIRRERCSNTWQEGIGHLHRCDGIADHAGTVHTCWCGSKNVDHLSSEPEAARDA